jgi:hypothetical protein
MSTASRSAGPSEWVNELRRQLENVEISSVSTIERSEIISIINVLVDHVGPLLAETKYTSTGIEIIIEHIVVGQLKHLARGLQDLDRGIPHPALTPASSQANAALSAEQREYDRLLLEAVTIARQAHRFSTLRQAEKYVAERFARAGRKRRGKVITASVLRSLRDHPKKAINPRPE